MNNTSTNKYLNNFQIFLFSCLPCSLVIGPLIAEIIINIILIFFLFDIVQNKNFKILKNKIFYLFSFFYLVLIISLIKSDIFAESGLNVFSYLRFFLFAFAACELLKKNELYIKLFYICLSLTIFIVVSDGYLQFFNGENLLGYPKYRPDRISGFFDDDLIIGSYLLRNIPIFIGLTFYLKNSFRYLFYFNQTLILFTCILIFLSGERASFFLMILFLFIIILQINLKKNYVIIFFSLVVLSTITILFSNQILKDRYISQLKFQIFGEKLLRYYSPMFNTAYKMFIDKPFFGFGPKAYRYYCSDEKYVNFYTDGKTTIDNTIIKPDFGWKVLENYKINKIYISAGDYVEKGSKVFSYYFVSKDKSDFEVFDYFSKKEGIVKKIYIKEKYVNNTAFAKIEPLKSPKSYVYLTNSCNTHPHNTYLQLLSETGMLGFLIVFSVFIYLLFNVLKNLINIYFFNKRSQSVFEICLLANFLIILWPLTTSGNFFNNWLNICNFIPLAFYLFIKQKNHNRLKN